MNNNLMINRAYANWIEPYLWKWFLTLTFIKPYSPDTAKILFKRFVDGLGEKVIFFMVIEWHKWRNNVHIHAFLGEVEKRIFWPYGINKIIPYDRDLGARYYITKHITSEHSDYDFNFHTVDNDNF